MQPLEGATASFQASRVAEAHDFGSYRDRRHPRFLHFYMECLKELVIDDQAPHKLSMVAEGETVAPSATLEDCCCVAEIVEILFRSAEDGRI